MPQADRPLVSVLMACWNAERHVRSTLDMILAQTYRPIEVIVVDDGSTDATRSALKSYAGRVKVLTTTHCGQSACVNRAFAASRGAYINFHDSDDRMDQRKIERQMAAAIANPGAAVYGPWRLAWPRDNGPDRVELRQMEPVGTDEDMLEMHLRGWFCPAHSYLWPREVVDALGGWDTGLAADKDADFAMRALVRGVRLVYAPGSWVDYVQHPGQRESTQRTGVKLRSRARVTRKIARLLEEEGRLKPYREAIAFRYDDMARDHWEHCRTVAAWCAREARRVSGGPCRVGKWHYRLARRVLGVYAAEALAGAKRRLARMVP